MIDLDQSRQVEQAPLTILISQSPSIEVIPGGAIASRQFKTVTNASNQLPVVEPKDLWKVADMWEPYLNTVSKGASNYKNLGYFASDQDVTTLQSILRFNKNQWIQDVCFEGVTAANLPQSL